MKAPVATALVILLLGVGAREQCVPGPFQYTPDDDGGDAPFPDGCAGGDCIVSCEGEEDCRQSFGPDSRCVSGECRTYELCTVGVQDQFCENADETCAYDPAAQDPAFEGVCLPVASSPAALGEPCSIDDQEVNPCGGSAFCLVSVGGQGLCVEACDADDSCSPGFNCSTPFSTFGGRLYCMPACDLDNPNCGDDRLVCMLAQGLGGTSCTPDNGACLLAGCAFEGCNDLCPGGAECDEGTFCIESVVVNCRNDGPEQTFAACNPPGEENQPCVLTEPGSCVDGLTCSPSSDGSPRCAQ